MLDHKISPSQFWAFLAVAMSAPLSHYANAGWLAVLLAAGAMLPLTMLFPEGWRNMGRVVSLIQVVWISVVLAELIRTSGACWPGGKGEWVVPLTLLVAVGLAGSGEKAGRICATLFWLLAALYAPVLFGAAAQLEPEWLEASAREWNAELLVTLLLPGLSGIWISNQKGKLSVIAGLGLFAVILAALIQAVLSVNVGIQVRDPLYEVGRTLRMGGISRFEPLVSVAKTLGWYGLCSYLVRSGTSLAGKWAIPEKWAGWLIVAISAGVIVFALRVDGRILVGGCVVLWILVPMVCEKRSQKTRKSA